ncbi:MAG: hypothetical protein E6R14_00670 [Thermomicrobiales bacterium]|nr:MAG: hypothetical protein E6R14_00670 [Thermomicrobiales bacterium]
MSEVREGASTLVHAEFARWYGKVAIDGPHEDLQMRSEGIRKIVARADAPVIEGLIRLAFETRQLPANSAVQTIRGAMKEADESFPSQGIDREMHVLAGASLAVLLEAESSAASRAALAISTTGFAGARKPDSLPMDLVTMAEDALERMASAKRRRPMLSNLTSANSAPKIDFEKAAAKAREVQNWDGVGQAFTLAAVATGNALAQMAKMHVKAVQATDTFLQVQDEELQMLWWLIGQRSWDYDCSFDAVPPTVQPLVFSAELAAVTKIVPGPQSVKAMLSRAGIKEQTEVPIAAAVKAAESTWLHKLVQECEPSPVTTPIHFAIKRQLETGAGDAWVAGWAAATEVDAGYAVPALTLGTLFYRERLVMSMG